MGLLKRIFGICETKNPADDQCWTYKDGRVEIDLHRASELSAINGAIRLKGKSLPQRVLVMRGKDDRFHAFVNKCSHMGRRLDPLPEGQAVRCCSVMHSVYDYSGGVMSGPARKPIASLPVTREDDRLFIAIARR
jgi:nitrite reductase/ring-hydroxylating ferredoxin subunit